MDNYKTELEKVFKEYKLKSVFISGPYGVGKTTLVNNFLSDVDENKILRINFFEQFNEDSWFEFLYYNVKPRKQQSLLYLVLFAWIITSISSYKNITEKIFVVVLLTLLSNLVVYNLIPLMVKKFATKSFKHYEKIIKDKVKGFEYIVIDDIDRVKDAKEQIELFKMIAYIFDEFIGQVDNLKDNNVKLIMIGDLDSEDREISKKDLDKYIHWIINVPISNVTVEETYYNTINNIITVKMKNLEKETKLNYECEDNLFCEENLFKKRNGDSDENELITFRHMQKSIIKCRDIITSVVKYGEKFEYIMFRDKINHGRSGPYLYKGKCLYTYCSYDSINFRQFLYEQDCYIPEIPLNRKAMNILKDKCLRVSCYLNYVVPFIILSNFNSNYSDYYFDYKQDMNDSYMKDFLPKIIKMDYFNTYEEICKLVTIAFYLNLEYKLEYNMNFSHEFVKYWNTTPKRFRDVFLFFEKLKNEIISNETLKNIYEFVDCNSVKRNGLFDENDRLVFDKNKILNFNNVIMFYIDNMEDEYLMDNKEDIVKFLRNTYATNVAIYPADTVITDESYLFYFTTNKKYAEMLDRTIRRMNLEEEFKDYALEISVNDNIFTGKDNEQVVEVRKNLWKGNDEK